MNINPFKKNRCPEFTNETGVKWWRQKVHYNNIKADELELAGYSWWYTEHPDGNKDHIILKDQNIVKTTKRLDDVGVFLDMMLFKERSEIK